MVAKLPIVIEKEDGGTDPRRAHAPKEWVCCEKRCKGLCVAPRPAPPLPTAAGNSDHLELQGSRRTRRAGITLRCPKRATNEKFQDGGPQTQSRAERQGMVNMVHRRRRMASKRPEDACGQRETAPTGTRVASDEVPPSQQEKMATRRRRARPWRPTKHRARSRPS